MPATCDVDGEKCTFGEWPHLRDCDVVLTASFTELDEYRKGKRSLAHIHACVLFGKRLVTQSWFSNPVQGPQLKFSGIWNREVGVHIKKQLPDE